MYSLPQLLQQIQQYTLEHPLPNAPTGLYEPCTYMLDLGGKRLRPAFLLMAYNMYKSDIEYAMPAAWAIEQFHNFTLMHDDIMDAAPLRRGKATVHTKWNLNTAILSGDVMLILAYAQLAQYADASLTQALLRIFNRVAIGVCEGQQLDVNFETQSEVSLDAYIQMIELKTAVLLGGALEMGARCAGANETDAKLLYEFGRLAGIAFQIQDDLLDTFGDPEKFGKQVGGDILQNKKTFLVLKTYQVAPQNDVEELHNWMKTDSSFNGDAKIKAVQELFIRNGIPQMAEQAKQAFQTEAFLALDAVQLPESNKSELRQLVSDLLIRES
ncbi:MAG: polyprenyl synthetase family protein [Bacteroidetes bacterium]|nr:polyprenyl synthetase family protein [Bacteroidota bacterium]